MNAQVRAIEIIRRHPMAEWLALVDNEPLELREPLRAELKVYCDRLRAARLARASDPASSHAAAARVTQNGSRDDHVRRIIRAVRQHPGRTSAELARLTGLERHEAARRTSDAEQQGAIRKGEPKTCSVGGRSACTWWPPLNEMQWACLYGEAA